MRRNRGKWKGRQSPEVEPRVLGLSCQCSSTEPWQPDNHHPSQSSMIFRCFEEIENWEKAGSHQELNPGSPASVASALPLSYGDGTTASPYYPLFCLKTSNRIVIPLKILLWVRQGFWAFCSFNLSNAGYTFLAFENLYKFMHCEKRQCLW